MSVDVTHIDDALNTKNRSNDDGALKELKRYGLDKVESFSKQVGQIGGKIKGLFSGALSVFRKKNSFQTMENNSERYIPYKEIVLNKINQADKTSDEFVVDSEDKLYKKIKIILERELPERNDKDVASAGVVELFKREVRHNLQRFMDDEKLMRDFIKARLDGKILLGEPPVFQLIEKDGMWSLVSNNFIDGANKHSEENKDDVDDDSAKVVENEGDKRFFNIEKASEALSVNRDTLTEQLVSAVEAGSNGKVDQADWYEVGGMSANEALEMLRQILNRRVEKKQFGEETRQWIEDGINIFKPASDETFAEYVERRFMKGGRLPSTYNNVVNVIKIFNKIQNRKNNNKKEVVDRQMIGEMPVEKVFDILKSNKKVRENKGIKSILNNDIKPLRGESLRRYFYRLVAFKKGYLKKDGTVDEKKLRNDSDFKNIVKLLIDIIPPMNRRLLLGGINEDTEYYEYYNPAKNKEYE